MRAEAKPLSFILNEGVIRIPFFQRSYVWIEDNWEELFNDLIEEKSHFLGSLIFKQQDTRTGSLKEVLLIDGQQRLTTVSILLRSLLDYFDDETRANVNNTIFSYLYYKIIATDREYYPKIKHSKNDSYYFDKILLLDNDRDSVITDKKTENKLVQCYQYFIERIKVLGKEGANTLFNKLTNTNYKMFVIIDLESEDDEQEIFDTINSSGVRLSSADIVKNALFQRALVLNPNLDSVSSIYNQYWFELFQKDGKIENAWLQERNTGRIKRDNIEVLLHSIAVIKGIFDPEKDTLANISTLYKKYFDSLEYDGILSFLAELQQYGNIYYKSFVDDSDNHYYSFNNSVKRTIHIIEELQLSTFYPLIMYVIKEHSSNMDAHLRNLERFVLRRAVAGESTKNYNKDVISFIKELSLLEPNSTDHISDEDVEIALQYVKNNLGRLILFWIELYIRSSDDRYNIKELSYDFTLEHIMPVSWEANWSDVPVYNKEGACITDENQAKEERNNNIYSIGNMLLLNRKLNSQVSNSCFSDKVDGLGGKKGILEYSDLAISKPVIFAMENENSNGRNKRISWDETNIRERTKDIYNFFKEIW